MTSAPDCRLFNFIVWGLVGSVICCFGFAGNLLSLVSFQRDRRSPTTTLLQCLAASDFLLLLSVFTTDALPYICSYSGTCPNPWSNWPYIRYIWILTPASHMCSIWFVVLIALNRYWAVCKPHSIHQVWSNFRLPFYVLGAISIIILFNIPRYFEYKMVEIPGNTSTTFTEIKEERTAFGSSWSYRVVYKVMLVNILLIMIPILLLIVMTFLILRSFRHTNRRLESRRSIITIQMTNDVGGTPDVQGNKTRSSSSKSRAASEITFILVTVVIVAIVCQTPLAVFHFVRYSHRYYCGDTVFYLDNISKLLVNINCCINFVIYCICGRRFRQLLVSTIRCKRIDQFGSTGVSSLRTVSTRRT